MPFAHLFIALSLAALTAPALAQTPAAQPPASAPASAPPATPAKPSAPPVKMPPRMNAPEAHLGNLKAAVTVVEYASDTCPHCARFAAEVFPAFKKKYVDTGKVLYVFREFPTDPANLSVAGFLVARCAGEAHYFDVLSALFQAQTTAKTGLEFLMAGAKAGGLSEDQVKACLTEEDAFKALSERVQHAVDVEKIDGTPTFLINGKKMSAGEKTLQDFDAALQPLLPAKTAKPAVKKRRNG